MSGLKGLDRFILVCCQGKTPSLSMLPGLYYMFLVVETYVKRFFNTDFHHNTETTFTNASVHITMIIFHVVNRNVRALDKRVIVNVSKNGTVAISEIG